MTDKEVILNGIDVSKCEYCLKMTKYRCIIQRDVYKCLCEENPNCYFKQLKRKEKACKEWKEEYRAKVEELNELEEKLLHKEQECEELKEDRERWKSNFNGKVSAIEELLHQLDQLKAEMRI